MRLPTHRRGRSRVSLVGQVPRPERSTVATGTGGCAVLLGDSMDMAHALRRGGARVTVVADRHAPARFSRHRFGWRLEPSGGDQATVDLLLELARDEPLPLFYETDRDLLLVSRCRKALEPHLRMLLPPAELVEQLVDKALFRVLAERLSLRVPESAMVPTSGPLPDPGLGFPVLIKPSVRDRWWDALAQGQKAAVAPDLPALRVLLRALSSRYDALLAQRYIPGSASRVESYHVYVDAAGQVAAEFCGRKVRTLPVQHGYSTAVSISDSEDVLEAGRAAVLALGLVGVAKLDFIRDPAGRLWLLEVNARFTLWNNLGAAAGVDIPAMVMADLMGRARPAATVPQPGTTWCHIPRDLVAARQAGVPLGEWLPWARSCSVTTGFHVRDPLPFLVGRLWPRLIERVHR